MYIGRLEFHRITDRPDLLAAPTREYLLGLPHTSSTSVAVAEIDPIYAGGEELCAHYDLDLVMGANCIIIEATRGDKKWYVACLVLTGSRMDLNGFVRKHLHARRVSLAPKDKTISLTGMEYGSITVVGLPKDWPILIDVTLIAKPMIIIGSGLATSKLALPGDLLKNLPNVEVIENLGIRNPKPHNTKHAVS